MSFASLSTLPWWGAKDFEKVNEEAGTNFDLNLLFPPEDPKKAENQQK